MPVVKDRTKKHPLPPRRSLLGRVIIAGVAAWFRRSLKVTYIGLENLPPQPYILAANHVTFVDGLFIFKGLPKEHYENTCAMVGADLETQYGVVGKMIMRAARAIPVARQGNPTRGLLKGLHALEAEMNLLIHPEGTRTHDGHLGSFHSGASYLAFKANVPIVPIYIAGGYDFWPRHSKWPSTKDPDTGLKRQLSLTFFPPLLPEEYASPEELHEALHSTLKVAEADFLSHQDDPVTK